MAGLNSPPERVEALRAQMGLDRPLIVQYGAWIAGLVRGDFGTAMLTGQPVAALGGGCTARACDRPGRGAQRRASGRFAYWL